MFIVLLSIILIIVISGGHYYKELELYILIYNWIKSWDCEVSSFNGLHSKSSTIPGLKDNDNVY